MPKLSSKHPNQQAATIGDFTGGLNTAASEEFIQDNQLSESVNMEIDMYSKKLCTVLGTVDVTNVDYGAIKFSYWDNINSKMLLFTDTGSILAADEDMTDAEKIGRLEGTDYDKISAANWEDGVLIANGGHLQYATTVDSEKLVEENGKWKYITDGTQYQVETIETSPNNCYGVFIRSGRVVVYDGDDNLLYSGVGDETDWEQDANDPSAALFAEIGYKAGGKIISVCPNSTDILILKDNGLCYKLAGEYPDWKISEVSRELYCKNIDGSCSLGTGTALVLGNGILQAVSTSQDYGDMQATQVGQQVANQLATLPEDTKLRYLATYNQVWFVTGTQYVLVYDVGTQGFSQRWFNANVNDVTTVGKKVYLMRDDRISMIDYNNGYCQDCGEPLIYQARFKTDLSPRNILVKSVGVNITPLVKHYEDANAIFSIGKIDLKIPDKIEADELIQTVGPTQKAKEQTTNLDERYLPRKAVFVKARRTFRSDRIRIFFSGKGFPFILNFITYDKVEV